MKVIQSNKPPLNYVIEEDIGILETIDLQSQEFYFWPKQSQKQILHILRDGVSGDIEQVTVTILFQIW